MMRRGMRCGVHGAYARDRSGDVGLWVAYELFLFNLDKYNADEIPDKPAPIIQTSHCKLSFNLLVLILNAFVLT